MPLELVTQFTLGVEELDTQHREFFAAIDRLMDAMREGKGREQVVHTIVFLERYAVRHFRDEERHMELARFPGVAEHAAVHAAFVRDVAAIRVEFEATGATLPLVVSLNRRLGEWMRGHILLSDQAFGRFVQSVGGRK